MQAEESIIKTSPDELLAMRKASVEYQAKFKNWGEIARPAHEYDPQFMRAVQEAVVFNDPLKRVKIDSTWITLPASKVP